MTNGMYYLQKGAIIMLTFKKIEDKSVAKVMNERAGDPCKYAGQRGAYDCLYDCTAKNKPRYYESTAY